MAKLKKAITNQAKPDELKEKIEAIDESPDTPTEPTQDEPIELNIGDIRSKPPEELTDEEQTFLEENSDTLTDEEKTKFNIEVAESPQQVPEEVPEEPEVPEDDTDWKARYKGSTQEAQVLASRNKDLIQAVNEASAITEPTDDDMQKEYGSDWDIMDNIQRRIAKDNFLNKKRFELVDGAVQKTKKSDEWAEKVKVFVEDPKTVETFPGLKGKEVEFSQFSSIPTRVGVDFGDLVKAFLFDIPPVRPQRKTLFETKGGGAPTKPKELSPEEIAFLRVNDQKKYKGLVKSGKIKIDL